MAGVKIDQLGIVKPSAFGVAGDSNFWTPNNIKEIISGVTQLFAQYVKLKGGAVNDDVMDNSRQSVLPAPSPAAAPVITMAQVLSIGKQLCTNLEGQGYGDNTILEVIQKVPLTIKQIKGLL